MFWTWFGLAGLSLLRPVGRAWIETLAIGAALFAAIPIADLLAGPGLFSPSRSGDSLSLAFDATMVLLAVLLGFAARRIAAPRVEERPRRRRSSGSPVVEELADVA